MGSNRNERNRTMSKNKAELTDEQIFELYKSKDPRAVTKKHRDFIRYLHGSDFTEWMKFRHHIMWRDMIVHAIDRNITFTIVRVLADNAEKLEEPYFFEDALYERMEAFMMTLINEDGEPIKIPHKDFELTKELDKVQHSVLEELFDKVGKNK